MQQQIFNSIRNWAEERNLIEGSHPDDQFKKLIEEQGKLTVALLKRKESLFIDAVGDVVVVLTILCKQMGIDIEECIHSAYNEIKDSKGRMVNGVFVKESN